MSDKTMARRTDIEINFDGTDITGSIRPYLLSVTYTDNEEDETDDLQIKLQDRDSVWRGGVLRGLRGRRRRSFDLLQGNSQDRAECPLRAGNELQ